MLRHGHRRYRLAQQQPAHGRASARERDAHLSAVEARRLDGLLVPEPLAGVKAQSPVVARDYQQHVRGASVEPSFELVEQLRAEAAAGELAGHVDAMQLGARAEAVEVEKAADMAVALRDEKVCVRRGRAGGDAVHERVGRVRLLDHRIEQLGRDQLPVRRRKRVAADARDRRRVVRCRVADQRSRRSGPGCSAHRLIVERRACRTYGLKQWVAHVCLRDRLLCSHRPAVSCRSHRGAPRTCSTRSRALRAACRRARQVARRAI